MRKTLKLRLGNLRWWWEVDEMRDGANRRLFALHSSLRAVL
jgi:hypothetical protein